MSLQLVSDILRTRSATHGDPSTNIPDIGAAWEDMLDVEMAPKDVCRLMIGLKLCRLKSAKGGRDNWLDVIGYAALGAAFEDEK